MSKNAIWILIYNYNIIHIILQMHNINSCMRYTIIYDNHNINIYAVLLIDDKGR